MNKTNRPSRAKSFRAKKSSGKHNFKKPNQRNRNNSKARFNKAKVNKGSNKGQRSGGRKGGRVQPTYNPERFINTNPREVVEEIYKPKHKFDQFGLNPKIVKTLSTLGIKSPSPIQDQIIPLIMKGRDVVGIAETGTGKTAAFLLPLIEKTLKDKNRLTLVVTPTRELAIQINEEFRSIGKEFMLFSTVCVGGMNIGPQVRGLKKRNNFVIGTPGRLIDLINRKDFDPRIVTTVVLDEADRMLDMGFIGDMKKILSRTPTNRETLFFSATMPEDAKKLVNDFLKNPLEVSVKKKDVTDSIKQDVVQHGHHDKYETLVNMLRKVEFKRVIIFGAMKHSVKRLARELTADGIKSESIHGNKTHSQRQKALAALKNGDVRVLVATDVAARGIHVDGVSHVINYDLPASFEDYVHRIGRTGRGKRRGMALTFVPKKAVKDRI
jgi:superfamily II DNA/RNA helicase